MSSSVGEAIARPPRSVLKLTRQKLNGVLADADKRAEELSKAVGTGNNKVLAGLSAATLAGFSVIAVKPVILWGVAGFLGLPSAVNLLERALLHTTKRPLYELKNATVVSMGKEWAV